jgi:hypothetical protein
MKNKKIKPKKKQLKTKDIPKVREKILKDQCGLCPICKKEISDPCLDHHHKKKIKGTGLIRGVLCRSCNVFIAKAENNCVRFGISQIELPSILRNFADYLEKEHYPLIHPSEKPKEKKLSKQNFKKLAKLYKEKYPKRKPLEYPKSKKLTKKLAQIYKEFKFEPTFLKGK